MGAPPWVTPGASGTGQVPAGPAVRDYHRQHAVAGGGWAACRGTAGDVGSTGQIPVPGETALRAEEVPPGGLGHPPPAGGAGGGGAPFIYQMHGDPGLLRLVRQAADQAGGPPVTDSLVVPPPGVEREDTAG